MGILVLLAIVLIVIGIVLYRHSQKKQRYHQKKEEHNAEQSPKSDVQNEQYWQAVFDRRCQFFEEQIGELPNDMQKIAHMMGVWPGGGLFQIQAKKLGNETWVHTTFGFSNADMPTKIVAKNISISSEDSIESNTKMTLARKENVPSYPGRPGYGYELMIATNKFEEWPLWVLQWAVNAEILNDADLLGRVENYAGLTVEDVSIGESKYVNLLIAKAEPPLPALIELPNGKAEILIATTITDDEMKWSMNNSRPELLEALLKSGNGQMSDLERASVFNPEPLDYSTIKDTESAKACYERGLLRKVYLFPTELGGPDAEMNICYAPKSAALQKQAVDNRIAGMAERGLIMDYAASPEYKGDSVIPASLVVEAKGEDKVFRERIEIW